MQNSEMGLSDIPAWELDAYADGANVPHIAQYFASHPDSYNQWLTETRLFTSLKKSLFRFECSSLETLQHYHWQALSSHERERVEKHLQLCPLCTEELATLRRLAPIDNLATHPHATWIAQLKARLARLKAQLDDTLVVVASLVTLPTSELATANLRSDTGYLKESDDLRFSPKIYEYEETTVLITVQHSETSGKNIYGQLLLPFDAESYDLLLLPRNPTQQDLATRTDSVGKFEFLSVAEDDYEMYIFLHDKTLVISRLSLV